MGKNNPGRYRSIGREARFNGAERADNPFKRGDHLGIKGDAWNEGWLEEDKRLEHEASRPRTLEERIEALEQKVLNMEMMLEEHGMSSS